MLRAEKISYRYDKKFSLENINLEVSKGEIVAIIGHSGSGKSTLLHILAGLKNTEGGNVYINDERLLTPSQKLVPGHEKIKLVTQQNTLFPNFSIFENIAYELRYYEKGYQVQRVKYLAESLGIEKLLDDKPNQLSGGEIQRVMIAKALADEPYTLLLDEPFANLDRIYKKRAIRRIVDTVKDEDIACVMVTHDIYDAFGAADRLIIMKDGRILQEGTSEEIYLHPVNRYVAEMTGELNVIGDLIFRPEHGSLNPDGNYTATVISSMFQGLYFENTLMTDGHEIILYSIDELAQGVQIRFDVNSIIHLN